MVAQQELEQDKVPEEGEQASETGDKPETAAASTTTTTLSETDPDAYVRPADFADPNKEGMQWYVVHTYSGFENKAKTSLEERVRSLRKADFFSDIIVPEENVIELVKGQKKTTKRRFFPGYILVKMILNNETWHIVKDTPRITGFVGDKVKPRPVPESEVKKMTNRIAEGESKPRHRVSFKEGENIRVVDGPFSNFNGTVEEVNMDKGKVKVLVSIFGRSTPVELDFIQVEKV